MGDQLALLAKASLDYLKKRSGFRFTSQGKQRQADVQALVKVIGAYLPEARSEYAKKIGETLKGSASSADAMPKEYQEFYQENRFCLDQKEDIDAHLKRNGICGFSDECNHRCGSHFTRRFFG